MHFVNDPNLENHLQFPKHSITLQDGISFHVLFEEMVRADKLYTRKFSI